MKILIIVLGIIGVFFLLGFGYWFKKHPISRDRVLSKFGKPYFRLLIFIVCSSIFVIAGLIELIPVIGKLNFLSKLNLECLYSISEAIKYCTKMGSPKDENVWLTVLVMLFQIVVFEGLIIAAIVGWTGRRTKKIQKGQVRYSKEHLNGKFVSLWDTCDKTMKWYQLCWNHLLCYVKCLKSSVQNNSYAVVIGANEVAPSVIKNLLKHEDEKKNSLNYAHEKENKYVILQTCSEIEEVRQILKAYLTEEEYDHVIISSDIRYSYEGLKALHLDEASEIYVLGENTTIDGGETYHDTMNMRCVNLIADILIGTEEYQTLNSKKDALSKLADIPENEEQRKQLKGEIYEIIDRFDSKKRVCKTLFEYQTTFSIFQFSDVPDKVHYAMHFIPFNRYESWARRVMVDNKALALVDENVIESNKEDNTITYKPLDGYEGIKFKDEQRVHFIVVGMSKMGVAMGTQALFQAHYPNYVRDNTLKSRITFIDANAEQEMQFFKGRYATLFELARHRYIDANDCAKSELESNSGWVDPTELSNYKWAHLSRDGKNFLDVEVEFVKGELESEGVREYLRKVTADKNSKVTIAICLPLTHHSVAAALYMPLEVYDKVQEIWVYQREAADIITNLEHARETNLRYKKLRPFGMLYGEYIDSRTHYLKALLVNAAYDMCGKYKNAYLDMGLPDTYKGLSDSWNDLSVAQQWSNNYFVDSMYQKLRCMCGDDNDNASIARCEHNRWNVQQLLMGFAPADELKLKEFAQLEANKKTETARKARDRWRKAVNWKQMTEPLERKRAKEHILYKQSPDGIYDEKKNKLKHGSLHIHPNIIHYDLLDIYDAGAKGYDETLNNGIPLILVHVDGYKQEAWFKMKMKAYKILQ